MEIEKQLNPELPPDYYLTNFKTLISFVKHSYRHLLIEGELEFIGHFEDCSEDAQKLYVRLLTRKGNVFLTEKLVYQEIGSISLAIDELSKCGFVDLQPSLGVDDVFSVLTKSQIFNLLSALDSDEVVSSINRIGLIKHAKSLKRDELIECLKNNLDEGLICSLVFKQHRLLKLNYRENFDLITLCFFGNLYQSLTDFVLRDMGMYRYEEYELDKETLPFQSREQLNAQLLYYGLSEQWETIDQCDPLALIELEENLPEPIVNDFKLDRRLSRLRIKLARQLERLGEYELSLRVYQKVDRHPARERRVRIATVLNDHQSAFSLCREIIDQPYEEAELEFATSFAYRLSRKVENSNGEEWPKPKKIQPPENVVTLRSDGSSVEMLTANYLATEGDCFFVENSLVNGLLGLFIWDILFSPVSGAFHNPFQIAPSDFSLPHFVEARLDKFKERLAELEGIDRADNDRTNQDSTNLDSTYKNRIMKNWETKFGILNPFVNWFALDENLLNLALDRIPANHLLHLFKRILKDIPNNRSGLPDLILFPSKGGYKLIEVKGPGDKLQKNQLRWMSFFMEQDIPHEVYYIKYG